MRTSLAFFALSLLVAACATPSTESDGPATGDDQNVTAAKPGARDAVVGTWVLDDQSSFIVLVLEGDGTFRRHTGGMMTPGPELKRSEGKYELTVEDDDEILTLSVTKPEPKTLKFKYEARPSPGGTDLEGMPRRGQLMLRAEGGFTGDLGSPLDIYRQGDSWCNTSADCATSLANGGWKPESVPAACKSDPAKCASCKTAELSCELTAPK
jgi:hypothetical protein